MTDVRHCRFDSPAWLGEVLIDSLEDLSPASILDLGCGGGALSVAALRRWPGRELMTVDVDVAVEAEMNRIISPHQGVVHRHVTADVLHHTFDSLATCGTKPIDLVISNPPYRAAEWSPAYEGILRAAGLPAPSAVIGDIAADLIFVARAMTLVRPGGCLGLILPDSLISAQKTQPFRECLLRSHRVSRVVQLPRRAFKNTDAQTFIVIVERGGTGSKVRLDRINSLGEWAEPVIIDPEIATVRLDYAYHDKDAQISWPGCTSLRELGVEIRRGNLSSLEASASAEPTFHSSDFSSTAGGKVRLPRAGKALAEVSAVAGDILLARVDRNLERKIAIVASGSARLTDCVLRIRCKPELAGRIRKGLLSPEGQSQLTSKTRGTGARHISVASLMQVVV